VHARFRRNRTALDAERGERLTDDEVMDTLLRGNQQAATGVPRPAVQVAVTTCRRCKRDFVGAAGEQIEIARATADRLKCDAEDIGDLESDARTRVKPTIPAAIRRKVFHRDNFACVVPGCRATRNLDVHHVVHRKDGGKHSMSEIVVLCSGHHQQLHHDRLAIIGRAPDLTFEWRPDDDVETATTSPRGTTRTNHRTIAGIRDLDDPRACSLTTESLNEVTRFRRCSPRGRNEGREDRSGGLPARGHSLERVTSRCRWIGDLANRARSALVPRAPVILDEGSHRRPCSPLVSALSSSNAMIARSPVGLDVWNTEISFDHELSWARQLHRRIMAGPTTSVRSFCERCAFYVPRRVRARPTAQG
jgi:hypothetical protein